MEAGWHSELLHGPRCLEKTSCLGITKRTVTWLKKSAAEGCGGCAVIAAAVEKWCEAWVVEGRRKVLQKSFESMFDEGDVMVKAERNWVSNGGSANNIWGVPMLLVHFDGGWSNRGLSGSLEVFREPVEGDGDVETKEGDSPDIEEYLGLRQLIGLGRIRNKRSDSDACLSIVKSWLDTCSAEHPTCSLSDPKYIPYRVLDVNAGFGSPIDKVKLVENPTEKGEYIALSHCWGKSVPTTTTKGNLERRKDAIEITELPKTFQDAITMCRKLGVRYLWIDSLCILQDSAEDWSTESAKMHLVYSNATLVLAATRSPDSTHGLFHTRGASQKLVKNFYTLTPPSSSSSTLAPIPIHVRLMEKSPCHSNLRVADSDLAKFPLLTRAWCLQERILATRMVHFCEDELVWECHGAVKCECMDLDNTAPEISRSTRKSNWYFKKRWAAALANGDGEQETEKMRLGVYEAWHAVINAASKLQITKDSDRLPALSGMAQKMISRGAGRYLAGIWEDNLGRDLLWYAIGKSVRRLEVWRAPSWSWVSVEGGEVSFPDWGQSFDEDYQVEITDARCTLLDIDPTGRVAGGNLTITGLVTECLLGHPVEAGQRSFHERILHLKVPGAEEQLLCSMACDSGEAIDNAAVGTTVLTLLMRRKRRNPESNDPTPFHALVLRKSQGLGGKPAEDNRYERIGLIQWEMMNPIHSRRVKWEQWFGNAARRSVVVI